MKDFLAVLERAEVSRNVQAAVELYVDEVLSEGKTIPDPVPLPAMIHISI